MVSDYGPGHDAEGAFQLGVKEAGGEIVGSVRFPVANPDFSAFVQRAKDTNPDSIYFWIPGGTQPAAVGKALSERGIDPKKIASWARTAGRRQRAEEHGRRRGRHHHCRALRLQPPLEKNKKFVKGFNEISNAATPTSSRSAAMTAST